MRFIQRLGSPCCPVPKEVYDIISGFQELVEIFNKWGSTDLPKLYTNGTYVWAEGTNDKDQNGIVILAGEKGYLHPNIAGSVDNTIISSISTIEGIVSIYTIKPNGDNAVLIQYLSPKDTNSYIGKEIEVVEPAKQAFALTTSTENLGNIIDINIPKPNTPVPVDMLSNSKPTLYYLIYPLSWEEIEDDVFVKPYVTDSNTNFQVMFAINEDTPTITIDGIEYRVCDIELGKGIYGIIF